MCYNEQSLYLYLKKMKKKNNKKQTAHFIKVKQKPSPTESARNQFDVALTSMYTKVLTGWAEAKRSVKERVAVIVIINLIFQWKKSQCFHVSEDAPFAADGIFA